jgi:hypothetical protein
MSLSLRDEDRRAVDLLLDHAQAAHQGDANMPMTFGTSMTEAGVPNDRLIAAEKVLKMLDAMPSTEPAADLLARTLARVERQTGTPVRGHHPMIDAGRPVA